MLLQNNILVLATRNLGKVKEFTELFESKGVKVRSLADYSDLDLPEIIEDGETFADNARIKAQIISAHLHVPVLADDSGLCTDALLGAPGVYSARYAGEGAADDTNNAKLLAELSKLQPSPPEAITPATPRLLSPASFVCALALVDPVENICMQVEAKCDGYIIAQPRGDGGFGYDPLFYMPEFGKTMAELTVEEKNQVSHRAKALRNLMDQINEQQTKN
jgi:XTP/dITP diphosphohydrolase